MDCSDLTKIKGKVSSEQAILLARSVDILRRLSNAVLKKDKIKFLKEISLLCGSQEWNLLKKDHEIFKKIGPAVKDLEYDIKFNMNEYIMIQDQLDEECSEDKKNILEKSLLHITESIYDAMIKEINSRVDFAELIFIEWFKEQKEDIKEFIFRELKDEEIGKCKQRVLHSVTCMEQLISFDSAEVYRLFKESRKKSLKSHRTIFVNSKLCSKDKFPLKIIFLKKGISQEEEDEIQKEIIRYAQQREREANFALLSLIKDISYVK